MSSPASSVNTKIKRDRMGNWSSIEVEILLSEVDTNRSVLFASFSNTITNKRKAMIWESIAKKISASSKFVRTAFDAKKKWTTMKSTSRKKGATHRMATSQTVGGPPQSPLTEFDQHVISVIPACQVEGSVGGMESEAFDSEVPNATEDACTVFVEPACEPEEPIPSTSQVESSKLFSITHEDAGTIMEQPKPKVKPSTATNGCTIIEIEREKLLVQKQILALTKERLEVEKKRLKVEEDLLSYFKGVNVPFVFPSPNLLSVSPVIKL